MLGTFGFIKGITVRLHIKTDTGSRDRANRTIYDETSYVDVQNVLVAPSDEQEILDTLNLTGRKAVYTLGIPKGDTHDWENQLVEFGGHSYRTIGKPIKGIDDLVPLGWNMKVRCEIYDG